MDQEDVKGQLEGQSNKCVCTRKKQRKTHVEYCLAVKTQMVGACEVLLRDITEGRMKGEAYCGRRRLHMLSDLASSAEYPEVKRTAEDREGWRAIDRKEML